MSHFRFKLPGLHLDCSWMWNLPDGPSWDDSFNVFLSDADSKIHQKFESGDVGFYDWPQSLPDTLLSKIKSTSDRLRSEFEGVVVFGIGGSHLGAAAALDWLRTPKEEQEFPIFWLSNVDPASIKKVRHRIRGKKFAALVVSLSGNTVETLSGFFEFSKVLDRSGWVFLTNPEKGLLREIATSESVESFDLPLNIGGRFSVLTPVGLLPCALAGIDCQQLIAGAAEMRSHLEDVPATKNPAGLLALSHFIWNIHYKRNVHCLMPYWANLSYFADWWVQLFGESLGKKQRSDSTKSVGFTPLSALGSTDQHSLLQLFKEGPKDKVVGFMGVSEPGKTAALELPPFESLTSSYLGGVHFEDITQQALVATQTSLNRSGVPTFRVMADKAGPFELGALFFFFETVCAWAGELYDVDAYNQPGVEEAKVLLHEALAAK